jgi:hypothetical protein
METDVNTETLDITSKLYILDSKIKFANEQIFNYNIDLDLMRTGTGSEYDQSNIDLIEEYRDNANARIVLLNNMRDELISQLPQQ